MPTDYTDGVNREADVEDFTTNWEARAPNSVVLASKSFLTKAGITIMQEELNSAPPTSDTNKEFLDDSAKGRIDAVIAKAESLATGGHSRPVKIAVLGSPSGKSQIIIDSLSQMEGFEVVEILDFKVDESKLLSLKLEAPAYEARIDTWRPKNQRFGRVPQIGRHSGGRKTKRRK